MRALGKWTPILPLVAVLGASSCGARTAIEERRVEDMSSSGSSPGGGGSGGGTGGTHNPVISSSPDSPLQSETSVARAPNGSVAVAWIDFSKTGETNIGYVISTDDGASFPPPTLLSSKGGRLASDPVLAADAAGNFYLTWVGYFTDMQGYPEDMHIYMSKASAGSTTFAPPIEVSDPENADKTHDKPWIMVNSDGGIIITYAVATSAQSKLIAALSKDGVSFQESAILQGTTAFWNLPFPCTSPDSKRLWVTYLASADGNTNSVGLTWSDDGGLTFQPLLQNTTVSLPDETVALDDPSCVARGDEVWVAYGLTKDGINSEDVSSKSFAIRLAHSADGGKTIDARIDAHDAAAAPFFLHPQMVIEDKGAIDLAYYAGKMAKDKSASYRWSRAAVPALGFGPSEVIEAPVVFIQRRDKPDWLGDYTGLVWAGGTLYTSYAVNTTGLSKIAFAKVAVE